MAATRSRPAIFGRLGALIAGALAIGAAAAVAAVVIWLPKPGPPHALPTAPQHQLAAAHPPSQTIHVASGRPLVIGVFGDSLGDGVWWGLDHQLHTDKTFQVIRFSRAATGLSNYQFVNIHDVAVGQLASQPVDIAVVMVGANDEQGIVEDGKVYPFGTPGWLTVYQRRISDLVALLRQHDAAIYWVGLPKMKKQPYDAKAQFLNGVYEREAGALGFTFIPTVAVTSDAHGDYSDYLPDGGDPHRLMRANDGIHMTMAGYLRLAGPAMGAIRADIARGVSAQLDQLAEAGASGIAEAAASTH
jgi:hypothetical protein